MEKTLSEVIELWFAFFKKMKVGQKIEIAHYGKRDPKLFTDMCKCFIDDNPDYEISNDYKYFKKCSPYAV